MFAAAPLRTPGLYFETQAPEPRAVLPRLDIAGFVGFAASGPIGVPVAIEDPVAFEALFGEDLVLGVPGRQIHTQLAPAVRAFFRNGGRRCWVVRVAGAAAANEFVLPGIIGVRRTAAGIGWAPAIARARSEGSWSDSLAVNTTLLAMPLPREAVTLHRIDSAPLARAFWLTFQTGRAAIGPGELLRIDVGGSRYTAFVAVASDPIANAASRVEVPWSEAVWLETVDAGPWPLSPSAIATARHLLPSGAREPISIVRSPRFEEVLKLEVVKHAGRALHEGDWIELDLDAGGAAVHETWLLQIDRTVPSIPGGSPSSGSAGLEIEARRAWRFVDPPYTLPADSTIRATALTFELRIRDRSGRSVRLADLGFATGHHRCWCDLPTDADLFSSPGGALDNKRELARAALQPRFPLAGPTTRSDTTTITYLPLGVPAAVRPELETRAEPRPEASAARDGLKRIGAGLFLDPALRETSVRELLEHASRVRYAHGGGTGKRLNGLHALIDVDEISLIAAPDALLTRLPEAAARTAAPAALTLAVTATDARVSLEWPAAPLPAAYTLQQSETSDFQAPSLSERLVPGQSDALVTDDPAGRCKRRVDRLQGVCAPDRWYRVRIEGLAGGGPWSNTVRVKPASATFDACEQIGGGAPALSVTPQPGGVTASWTATGAARYRLESSPEPTFASAQLLFEGAGTTFSMLAPLTTRYMRVRAEMQPPGAWSNSVRVEPGSEVISPAGATDVDIDPATALEVNAALLTFCAARGDVLGVLGVPAEYSVEQALDHKARLIAPLLSRGDHHTPSFGALYFPWLVVASDRAADPEPPTVAPVGTICGLIAARTLAQGAWSAPANRPLVGVVSRSRSVDLTSWLALDAAQINAVFLQPRGYVTLGAHTLTPDRDLREVSVRRLLILLRRLLLRDGPSLVFEPNGPDLRRAARRQFERLLGELYERGALAGRTPAEAFQVIVDDTVNPAQSVDLGRLIVELRVAPSRPLAFLIVRFLLRGSGSAVVEGA